MRLFFLLIVVFSTLLQAYDIDQMLDLYRKDSDLSKKTKNESLGHLTIYTRDDLERMQAHNLGELLNSLRSFRYNENMLGMSDVLHTDPSLYSSDTVKIFINNHEITSAYAGSGLFLYGNIDLGFVDHVEIYEGSTSTAVNSEPAIITIKLYSKDPVRESGGHLQAYGGSRGTDHENVSYAAASKDFKYYLYASRSDIRRTHYTHENHDISRDYKQKHALMTLDYKNIKVGAEYIDHKADPFLSLSMFATPKDGDMSYKLKRVSSTMSFLDDDSLKLSLSFIRMNEHLNFNMDRTLWTTNNLDVMFLPQDSFVVDSVDDVYSAKLEKKILYKANTFLLGADYIKKSLHDVKSYENGLLDTEPTFVDNSIFGLYMQDDFAIAENQIITASLKRNQYYSKTNRAQRNFHTLQTRLGYIATSKKSTFKAFVSSMEIPTEQYALAFAKTNEIELLRLVDVSAEYARHINTATLGFCLEYLQNQNSKILIEQKDIPKYYDNYSASIKYDYDFDPFNSLKSMLFYNRFHNPVNITQESVTGGFVRLLNTYEKFDIYNEVDYYKEYSSEINGYMYNAGVRYRATPSLIFSLKGVNIFNSAATSRYSYIKMNGFTPEQKSLYMSPIDSTFSVGMEYSF